VHHQALLQMYFLPNIRSSFHSLENEIFTKSSVLFQVLTNQQSIRNCLCPLTDLPPKQIMPYLLISMNYSTYSTPQNLKDFLCLIQYSRFTTSGSMIPQIKYLHKNLTEYIHIRGKLRNSDERNQGRINGYSMFIDRKTQYCQNSSFSQLDLQI
jgi:hypothetical protein